MTVASEDFDGPRALRLLLLLLPAIFSPAPLLRRRDSLAGRCAQRPSPSPGGSGCRGMAQPGLHLIDLFLNLLPLEFQAFQRSLEQGRVL